MFNQRGDADLFAIDDEKLFFASNQVKDFFIGEFVELANLLTESCDVDCLAALDSTRGWLERAGDQTNQAGLACAVHPN